MKDHEYEENFFVDFHCHPTLRAMNSAPIGNDRNIWDTTFNPRINSRVGRWASIQTREIAKESQSNFYNHVQGGTRVIFDSLYPVEKGWYRFRRLPTFLVGEKAKEELLMVAFGIETDRLDQLKRCDGYFEELLENYDFITSGQGVSPNGRNRYRVVKNYAQLQHILKNEPDTLAVVLTIEGAHALETGAPCTESIPPEEHRELINTNISILKEWEYPVFYLNLAHHFYNQLCGHARSMKSPISLMYNQQEGLNLGIHDLGWYTVERLLDKKPRRILIDTKHMSLQSRREYFNYIEDHNRKYPDDHIPIISSHGGISGFSTMEEAGKTPDMMKKLRGSYHNNWSINLSEEEINRIHNSGGIMGLMMDKGLLASPETLRYIRKIQDRNQQKEAFIKLFLDNMFGIVKAIGKKAGWNSIAIGTDYDGIITHIDFYRSTGSMGYFKQDLLDFMLKYEYKYDLWFGYTPEEILKKVFQTNALEFLKTYF